VRAFFFLLVLLDSICSLSVSLSQSPLRKSTFRVPGSVVKNVYTCLLPTFFFFLSKRISAGQLGEDGKSIKVEVERYHHRIACLQPCLSSVPCSYPLFCEKDILYFYIYFFCWAEWTINSCSPRHRHTSYTATRDNPSLMSF
jgi:hypothetical protein